MIEALDAEAAGKPIGRAAEVNIRNNHLQYIVTWFVSLPLLARYMHTTDVLSTL